MLYLIPKYLISTGKTVEEDSVSCANMWENHGASQMSLSIQRVDFNQHSWHNVRDTNERLKGTGHWLHRRDTERNQLPMTPGSFLKCFLWHRLNWEQRWKKWLDQKEGNHFPQTKQGDRSLKNAKCINVQPDVKVLWWQMQQKCR